MSYRCAAPDGEFALTLRFEGNYPEKWWRIAVRARRIGCRWLVSAQRQWAQIERI
jgi:hypothetical protein